MHALQEHAEHGASSREGLANQSCIVLSALDWKLVTLVPLPPASPFSLPLTSWNESLGTQRCRARQGERGQLCGGGRVTAGQWELCREYRAENKVCVQVCVCMRGRETTVILNQFIFKMLHIKGICIHTSVSRPLLVHLLKQQNLTLQ